MMKLMRAARQDERFRDERALASPEVTHLVILGSIASILEAPVAAGALVFTAITLADPRVAS